jgi:cysteinyl-tRNA synthetase
MESISGKKPLVKYWMHTGFLNINKNKMSKSLGNFKTIRDLLKIYKPEVIRYLVISNHYRKPIDFSERTLENAKNAYGRLKNICETIEEEGKVNKEYIEEFKKEMNNDLNTPIEEIDKVLGLKLLEKEKIKIPSEIKKLVEERENARKEKNWKKADKIRDEIKEKGYALNDTSDGVVVKKNE